MLNKMKLSAVTIIFLSGFLLIPAAFAGTQADLIPLNITISSAKTLNGTAGDYVTITGQITNSTAQAISEVTTYLSLVDTENKLPVDLEDWSAEKGLYIGTIESGQSLPLSWKIHFVKAGTYALTVIAEISGQDLPIASSITRFTVQPKKNLNPGQVLPVALGMPILLLAIIFIIQYRRNKKVDVLFS